MHTEILPSYNLRAAVRHLKRADPALATAITAIGPCRLRLRAQVHPFESLLRAIIYQQLSGKAASTIYGRFAALFPPSHGIAPERLLELPDQLLRAAGLSRNKLLAVKDLASKTLEGVVPGPGGLDKLSDEEIVARLTAVRGVGRWTVEMLLIFTLGRPDVLPVDDLGVRKGFRLAYGMKKMPAVSTLLRAGKRWAPYRSVASWYLWRAADTDN
jgi:3-methyladenine DNA glycosylase/8-oxoguanine DNA glycosylase